MAGQAAHEVNFSRSLAVILQWLDGIWPAWRPSSGVWWRTRRRHSIDDCRDVSPSYRGNTVGPGRGQQTEVAPTTEDGGCWLRPLQKMVLQTPAVTENGGVNSDWEFRFFRTGQKVRTVCLPAWSTLILTICLCPWRAWTARLRLYILCLFILPYQSLLIPLNRVSHSVYIYVLLVTRLKSDNVWVF